MNQNNPIKRLAGETAIYGLGTIIPRLLNYLLVPFYTYLVFDQQQYGQITELYSYVGFFAVLLTFGLETAYFRYANKSENPQRVFDVGMHFLIFTSVTFVVLTWLFLEPIAAKIGYQNHEEYIMILAFVVALDAITALPFAWLRFHRKAKTFSTIKIINVVINISANVLLLVVFPQIVGENITFYFPYSSISNVGLVFIANLMASTATLLMILPVFKDFDLKTQPALLKKMLAYGLPVLVISLAGMVNEVADKIMMKHLLPDPSTAESQLGIYGANYKLAILMMIFIQMFRYAFEPFFFAEEKNKDSRVTYARVMVWFVIFTTLIFLGVTLYLDIFQYFVGPAFREGLIIVPIILAAKLFLGIFYNLSVWYKLTNKTLYGAIIAIIGAAITIGLNIYLIPRFGYLGAAWTNFAAYLTMMLISYFWGRSVYPVPYNLPRIFLYLSLGAGLYFLSRTFDHYGQIIRLSLNTLLLAVFLLTVYFKEFYKKSNITTN